MILAALGLLLAAAASPAQPVNQQEGRQETASNNQGHPSEQANISTSLSRVASALESENSDPHAADDRERSKQDLIAQQDMARWTWWMTLAAFIALGLSSIGVLLIYFTFKETRDQSADVTKSAEAMETVAIGMTRNVDEIVRSVDISDGIARVQRDFSKMQMRAYVSVLIGSGCYQTKHLLFQAEPVLLNTGNTPARKLRWKMAADLLPVPIPDDFRYPLPKEWSGGNVLDPGQHGSMSAVVSERLPDAEAEDVKLGFGDTGLYVWGVIEYRDVFKRRHLRTFAQQMFWFASEFDKEGQPTRWQVRGLHLPTHNRSS